MRRFPGVLGTIKREHVQKVGFVGNERYLGISAASPLALG
jgi:hypothetical protein